jgi:DNA-directed RNA polymerase specialized sigma24 family protein
MSIVNTIEGAYAPSTRPPRVVAAAPDRARPSSEDGSNLLGLVWVETARRVRGFLTRRGVPGPAAEDLCQEVAVRALRSRVRFVDADDLVPWACTVAWRVYLGDVRKSRRLVVDSQLCEGTASTDVENEVIGRLEFEHVVAIVGHMGPVDRQILMAVLDQQVPVTLRRAEALRLAVRRHRARARLRALHSGALHSGALHPGAPVPAPTFDAIVGSRYCVG